MKAATVVKSLRVSAALWEAIEARAAGSGVKVNAFISEALSQAVDFEGPPAVPNVSRETVRGPKRVKVAKRVLETAEAEAAHLGKPKADVSRETSAPHVVQFGPTPRPVGSLLKRTRRWP